jgi:hypothetical protein
VLTLCKLKHHKYPESVSINCAYLLHFSLHRLPKTFKQPIKKELRELLVVGYAFVEFEVGIHHILQTVGYRSIWIQYRHVGFIYGGSQQQYRPKCRHLLAKADISVAFLNSCTTPLITPWFIWVKPSVAAASGHCNGCAGAGRRAVSGLRRSRGRCRYLRQIL